MDYPCEKEDFEKYSNDPVVQAFLKNEAKAAYLPPERWNMSDEILRSLNSVYLFMKLDILGIPRMGSEEEANFFKEYAAEGPSPCDIPSKYILRDVLIENGKVAKDAVRKCIKFLYAVLGDREKVSELIFVRNWDLWSVRIICEMLNEKYDCGNLLTKRELLDFLDSKLDLNYILEKERTYCEPSRSL